MEDKKDDRENLKNTKESLMSEQALEQEKILKLNRSREKLKKLIEKNKNKPAEESNIRTYSVQSKYWVNSRGGIIYTE